MQEIPNRTLHRLKQNVGQFLCRTITLISLLSQIVFQISLRNGPKSGPIHQNYPHVNNILCQEIIRMQIIIWSSSKKLSPKEKRLSECQKKPQSFSLLQRKLLTYSVQRMKICWNPREPNLHNFVPWPWSKVGAPAGSLSVFMSQNSGWGAAKM